MTTNKKAVVLLSGGLDSAVALYIARQEGYDCSCLLFDYGQRHAKELSSAKKLANASGAELKIVKLSLPWKGSSLLDKDIEMPRGRTADRIKNSGIPSTYVPGRNTIFMSIAASFAEAIGAEAIFIGAHSEDSSGYPDCRIDYLKAFDKVVGLGTKAGNEGRLKLRFPLIGMSKSQIIKMGLSLGVPLELTWSCYEGGRAPCMECDSCVLRAKGFKEAGAADPALGKTSVPKAAVTEIFSSLQGEGVFVGTRQIFVRFKECNMDCSFCDTPNRAAGKNYSPAELMREIETLDRKDGPHHSVSLTGGEPLVYIEFLKKLLPRLKKSGFKAYLETNGTLPERLKEVINQVDIVAMDIKLPSSTKSSERWKEHAEFLRIASAKKVFVKLVVTADTKENEMKHAIAIVKGVNAKIPFIIQPATPVKRSDKTVADNRLHDFFEMASKHGIRDARVIPQVHKILGIK